MDNNYIYIGENYKTMTCDEFQKYINSIDMIYIDPPYNTKNTMSFSDSNDIWYEDILKRLEIAYKLLKDSGVIYISIDDKELVSLLTACYKIFHKENFGGVFITKQAIRSNSIHINIIHEYIVCFFKNKKKASPFYIKRLDNPSESIELQNLIKSIKRIFKSKGLKDAKKALNDYIKKYCELHNVTWIKNYNNIDENGNIFFAKDLSTPGVPRNVNIDSIGLHLKPLKTRGWSSDSKFINLYNQHRLCFKNERPYQIEYLEESVDNITSILDFYSRNGTNDLKKLGLYGLFDTPKPVEMIKFLIRATLHKNGIILDFYAGSGTTAQAVYEINKDDQTDHKYILIQQAEMLNSKSAVYKNALALGYNNPTVSDLMLLRINTFLEKNNLEKDYIIKQMNNDIQID